MKALARFLRKITVVSAAALAIMTFAARPMTMAHAQEAKAWLVTATITLGGDVIDVLYFRTADVYRTEAACQAFLDSKDERLEAANANLRKDVAEVLGPDAKVDVSCAVESDDED